MFAALGSVWFGFQYFSFASLIVLCLLWVYFLLKDYIYEYVTKYDEKFGIFFAKRINIENVDTEIAKKNIAIYKKRFNKTLIKEKLIEWAKILILYSIIGLCIYNMIALI